MVTAPDARSEAEQRKAISRFIGELAEPTQRGRLARWEAQLCPGVVGVSRRRASQILARITEEAEAVDVRVGKAGCRANVWIAVTHRPDQYTAEFRKRYGRFLAPVYFVGDAEVSGGGQKLPEFMTSDRPVRWWHVSARGTNVVPASRVMAPWHEELSRILVVVDGSKLERVTWEQLASYLSMAVLAQLQPGGEPKDLETIMTLFADRDAGRTPAASLTDWDRAYLKGVYSAPIHAANARAQKSEIRRNLEGAAKRP